MDHKVEDLYFHVPPETVYWHLYMFVKNVVFQSLSCLLNDSKKEIETTSILNVKQEVN